MCTKQEPDKEKSEMASNKTKLIERDFVMLPQVSRGDRCSCRHKSHASREGMKPKGRPGDIAIGYQPSQCKKSGFFKKEI